jgi:GT2 family glycosyltransferase
MDDGTSEAVLGMMRLEFPQVRYYQLAAGRGPAFQRNRGIELANSEFVFSVDDDTILVSPRTVEQTLAEFDRRHIGALAIPFIDIRKDTQVRQCAPSGNRVWVVHAFVGAAHAVRRSVFLQAGGYREHFFYMGEEGDLCLRLLRAGYIVRLGMADPIHHLESPTRDYELANYRGRRNDVLFAWHNVPLVFWPFHLVATTINGVRTALSSPASRGMLLGTVHGYGATLRRYRERHPVSVATYLLHRKLKTAGPCPLEEVTRQLPRVKESGDSGSG